MIDWREMISILYNAWIAKEMGKDEKCGGRELSYSFYLVLFLPKNVSIGGETMSFLVTYYTKWAHRTLWFLHDFSFCILVKSCKHTVS